MCVCVCFFQNEPAIHVFLVFLRVGLEHVIRFDARTSKDSWGPGSSEQHTAFSCPFEVDNRKLYDACNDYLLLA